MLLVVTALVSAKNTMMDKGKKHYESPRKPKTQAPRKPKTESPTKPKTQAPTKRKTQAPTPEYLSYSFYN